METNDSRIGEVVAELTSYQAGLYGFIYTQLGNRQTAEDVLQETNLSIWKNIGHLDCPEHFKPWAKTLAAYEILRYRKTCERSRIFFDSEAVDRLADSLEASAERSAAEEIPFKALEECLAKLPPQKRNLVKRRYWRQEPIDDIARKDASTRVAVSVRLLRIRKELGDCVRRLICKMGGGEPSVTPEESSRALLYESAFDNDSSRSGEFSRRLLSDSAFRLEWLEAGSMQAALHFHAEKLWGGKTPVASHNRLWRRMIAVAAAFALLAAGGFFYAASRDLQKDAPPPAPAVVRQAIHESKPAVVATEPIMPPPKPRIVEELATRPAPKLVEMIPSHDTIAVNKKTKEQEMNLTNTLAKAIGGAAIVAAGTLSGADKTWTGAVNGTWDTTTANWTDASGNAATFAAGDNAIFTDAATSKTVTAPSGLIVGNVVFSNETAYLLAGGGTADSSTAGLRGIPHFEKRGTGKLTISGAHSFTGDVCIAEGCLETTFDSNVRDARGSALGDPRSKRTILVCTNATLNLFGKGCMGSGTSYTSVQADIVVHGGTINFPTNIATTLGSALFDNASITYCGGESKDWPTVAFNGDWLRFQGTNAYSFPFIGNFSGISLGRTKPIELDVADITGNDDSDVIFSNIVKRIDWWYNSNPCQFTKTGAGTLELAYMGNTFTGIVRVLKGTLRCSVGNANSHTLCPLGDMKSPHTIYIGTNATLELLRSNTQGQLYNKSEITLHFDGGRLLLGTGTANNLGPTVFENATVVYSNCEYGAWATMAFNNGVTFKGTNVYTWPQIGNSSLSFGSSNMVDVTVEDITKNSASDVIFGMPINNCPDWINYAGVFYGAARPAQFRKNGSGTLELSNITSTMTGNIEVVQGVLKVTAGNADVSRTYGPLGNPLVEGRKISVYNGGELFYAKADVNGQLTCSNKLEIAVSNATFRIGSACCNNFGSLGFYNANFIYTDGSLSTRQWGVGGFGAKFKLDGTTPYNFTVNGNNNWFSLGYLTDFTQVSDWLYRGKTEWDVCNITTNGQVDVTFHPILQDMPNWDGRKIDDKYVNFSCGLKKTGAGTLRLTGANTYTGDTEVAEGALLIDSASSKSPVTVKAGGFIGGSGSVPSLTVEAGGGFEVFPDQTGVMKVDTLTLPEEGGMIRVRNLNHAEKTTLRATFLSFTTLNGTFNPNRWKVYWEGETSSALGVRLKGNTLYVRWSPPGTVIKLM